MFYDEFSDCDLIRVGKDFYLTGTTMHSMPGLPILHSRDLVNWRFLAYALDTLDLGPAFRLEDGKRVYGQGIWAPSFRFHKGTFHIFSNVNGQTTQLFRATNPAGPWTRTAMKRSFHDLSVLFDDDGKAYVVWGYRGIRLAELTPDLLDIVPGTEREIIAPGAGMGEGLHLYKIRGKYFLTSAWFLDEMRMPTARADRLTGPWEVNQEVSRGEDFGFAEGNRLEQRPPDSPPPPPFRVRAGNADAPGRNAIHQGGIVDTPTGEWWGFSMMDANSVGRLTALSPVTWSDGWPYFGLPKNLGRSPRIWVKPRTGTTDTADGAVPAQRRLLGGAPPADLAVEPRARRRQVVADRAQGPPPPAHPRRAGSARRAQHPDAARHRSAIDADRGARRVRAEARRHRRPRACSTGRTPGSA